MQFDSGLVTGFGYSYGGLETHGVLAIVVLALVIGSFLYSAWRIMRRMGLSNGRMLVYLVLFTIPFVQIWVIWDVAHRPWPGQPDGAWRGTGDPGDTTVRA